MTGPPDDALHAAEEAVRALARHDAAGARMAIAAAVALDESGSLGRLADAIHLAAGRLEVTDGIPPSVWDQLADAAEPGPLREIIEATRD